MSCGKRIKWALTRDGVDYLLQIPSTVMAAEPQHFRITYNQVHNLIKRSAKEIAEFKPDILLAIGTL